MSLITVSLNSKNFEKSLGKAPGKMKRVSAMALNSTAFDIRRNAGPRGFDTHIDRPTPFTKRGFRVLKAKSKQQPQTAWVYMAPIQDKYLDVLATGGVRKDDLPVPGRTAKLNKYGNLPRNATKAKRSFWIKGRGSAIGSRVTRQRKRGLKVIGTWVKYRFYKKTLPFFDIIRKGASRIYNREYRRAFNKVFK